MGADAYKRGRSAPSQYIDETPSDADALSMIKSEGVNARTLSNSTTRMMNDHFGVSMAGLQVFENSNLNDMGETAFAHGNEIHIAKGKFNEHSESGKEILMHEAAHVVQQGMGRAHSGEEDPALEAEAKAVQKGGEMGMTSSFSMPQTTASAPAQGLGGSIGKAIKKVAGKAKSFFGGSPEEEEPETPAEIDDIMFCYDVATIGNWSPEDLRKLCKAYHLSKAQTENVLLIQQMTIKEREAKAAEQQAAPAPAPIVSAPTPVPAPAAPAPAWVAGKKPAAMNNGHFIPPPASPPPAAPAGVSSKKPAVMKNTDFIGPPATPPPQAVSTKDEIGPPSTPPPPLPAVEVAALPSRFADIESSAPAPDPEEILSTLSTLPAMVASPAPSPAEEDIPATADEMAGLSMRDLSMENIDKDTLIDMATTEISMKKPSKKKAFPAGATSNGKKMMPKEDFFRASGNVNLSDGAEKSQEFKDYVDSMHILSDQWREDLSEQEEEGLYQYSQSNACMLVQEYLRGEYTDLSDEVKKQVEDISANVSSGLEKSRTMAPDTVAHRGVSRGYVESILSGFGRDSDEIAKLSPEELQEAVLSAFGEEGASDKTYVNQGFMSASIDRAVALTFAKQGIEQENGTANMLEIHAPEGTKAGFLTSSLSKHGDEKELLFDKNQRYIIEDIKKLSDELGAGGLKFVIRLLSEEAEGKEKE